MSDMTSDELGALDGADANPPPVPPTPPVQPPAEDSPGDTLLARFKARVQGKSKPREETPPPSTLPAQEGDTLLDYAGLESDFDKMFDSDDKVGARQAFRKILTQTARAAHDAALDDTKYEIDKTVKSERAAALAQTEDHENTQLVRQYIMSEVGENEGIFKMIVPMFLEHLGELTGGDPSKEPDNVKRALTMAKKTLARTVEQASPKKNPDSGTASVRGATPQNKPQEDSFDTFLADYARGKTQE